MSSAVATAPPNPFDDPATPAPSAGASASAGATSRPHSASPSTTATEIHENGPKELDSLVRARARRRREEAVARLVADATRPPDFLLEDTAAAASAATADDLFRGHASAAVDAGGHAASAAPSSSGHRAHAAARDEEYAHHHALETAKLEARLRSQQHSTLLLASTVASSIERGLDRELHSSLVRQGKEAQGVISKICHDYSEDFLESVGKVVAALGGPCEEVKNSLEEVRRLVWFVYWRFMAGGWRACCGETDIRMNVLTRQHRPVKCLFRAPCSWMCFPDMRCIKLAEQFAQRAECQCQKHVGARIRFTNHIDAKG